MISRKNSLMDPLWMDGGNVFEIIKHIVEGNLLQYPQNVELCSPI